MALFLQLPPGTARRVYTTRHIRLNAMDINWKLIGVLLAGYEIDIKTQCELCDWICLCVYLDAPMCHMYRSQINGGTTPDGRDNKSDFATTARFWAWQSNTACGSEDTLIPAYTALYFVDDKNLSNVRNSHRRQRQPLFKFSRHRPRRSFTWFHNCYDYYGSRRTDWYTVQYTFLFEYKLLQ